MGFLSKLACWGIHAHVPRLHKAVIQGKCISKVLLRTRNLLKVDINGRTPLHLAGKYGKRDVIEVILREADKRNCRQALIAITDNDGYTAVELAVRWPGLYTAFYPDESTDDGFYTIKPEGEKEEGISVESDFGRFQEDSKSSAAAASQSVVSMMTNHEPKPRIQNSDGMTGLRNVGNTCYMNAVLQILVNIHELREYFYHETYINDINYYNPLGSCGTVVRAFAGVVIALWSSRRKAFKPFEMKNIMGERCSVFIGSEQQDAQEFCAALLDNLHEDLNQRQMPEKSLDNSKESYSIRLEGEAARAWSAHISRNSSMIVRLLHGQLVSTVTCGSCQWKSYSYDPCSQISLPIPMTTCVKRTCSLQDCLQLFMEPELLDDSWWCQSCASPQRASKEITISLPPPILLFHLKRFMFGECGRKVTKSVCYPVSDFDLSPYVAQKSQGHNDSQLLYDLCGVICHNGSLGTGHYTSMARLIDRSNDVEVGWRLFDDAHVTSISVDKVVSCDAYVLVYRRQEKLNVSSPALPSVITVLPADVTVTPATLEISNAPETVDDVLKNCQETPTGISMACEVACMSSMEKPVQNSCPEDHHRLTSINHVISFPEIGTKIDLQSSETTMQPYIEQDLAELVSGDSSSANCCSISNEVSVKNLSMGQLAMAWAIIDIIIGIHCLTSDLYPP